MNMNDPYAWLNNLPRGVGHTTAACGKTPDRPGHERIVVVSSRNRAISVSQQLGVQAIAASNFPFGGVRRPVVFDTEAVQEIRDHYIAQIDRMRDEHADAILTLRERHREDLERLPRIIEAAKTLTEGTPA